MKSKNMASTLEISALVCFVMGFALYVGIDTGLVKLPGFSQRGPASEEALERPSTRVARLKALHEKIDVVESKMQEKVTTLSKMSQELEQYAQKLVSERKQLNSISTMVFEIEKDRAALKKESGVLSSGGRTTLTGALARIANQVSEAGISADHVASIKWQNKDFLRLVDAFEFQSNGPYMLSRGLARAEAVANAAEDAEVNEVTVVYRDPEKGGQELSRERAFVVRNHLREILGDEFQVKISRVNSDLVAPDSVELWMGE